MKSLTLAVFLLSMSLGAYAQSGVSHSSTQYVCKPFKVAFSSMKACQKFKSEQPKGACKCSKL